MSKEVKSPFELRMDMIATAKDLLEKQFELNKEIAITTWKIAVEAATAAQKAVPEMPAMPKFPTLDEIMETAQKMNSFVSGK